MNANKVILIRPYDFQFNEETSGDNIYQQLNGGKEVQEKALKEFEALDQALGRAGIHRDIIDDFDDDTPDSIFPNNTFVTFPGSFFISPMYADNRQREIEKFLPALEKILPLEGSTIVDFRKYHGISSLEGTGSMVIDRFSKIAYAALSQRTDEELFINFCKTFDLTPVAFQAFQDGKPVYHTNVMMTVGEQYVLIALELIRRKDQKKVLTAIEKSGKKILPLTGEQVKHFAGNALELKGKKGNVLMISTSGYSALTSSTIQEIEESAEIISVDVSTIEKNGGGSVRCMIAENFME